MPRRTPASPSASAQDDLRQETLSDVIGYQVVQAGITTLQVFERCAGQPLSLRPVEYSLLALIRDNPGIAPARLARALSVTPPNITMWVAKLEARQLVRREASTDDRRAQHLRATPAGEKLVNDATRRILEGEQQRLAALTPGERSILTELLRKLAQIRFDRT
ncbi:MarR family transcriptional regulator [Aquincola sp. S2]|uniref:MarR family transcriptional regulator n=1 Tax=Pseudaquabacterium terrae TaxID=2732868 RepID=A0ABX2ENA9_9BURK|nr:MarR family transcriptional regulator [Aquabacterium terrae]NRF70045.1 MarR family transcriptional regulator [Aquabacterium terrae]